MVTADLFNYAPFNLSKCCTSREKDENIVCEKFPKNVSFFNIFQHFCHLFSFLFLFIFCQLFVYICQLFIYILLKRWKMIYLVISCVKSFLGKNVVFIEIVAENGTAGLDKKLW